MRQSVRDVKGQPGYALEEKAVISGTAVVASVAIPLVIYLGLLWGRYAISLRTHDRLHLLLLLILTAAVFIAALLLPAAGLGTEYCLLVLLLAPAVSVVGPELAGHRHMDKTFRTSAAHPIVRDRPRNASGTSRTGPNHS